jgi:hypothetical protein
MADSTACPKATTWELADLATHADLAALFRVSASAIVNWTNRHSDFPAPLVSCSGGATHIYSAREVIAWWLGNKVNPELAEAFMNLKAES